MTQFLIGAGLMLALALAFVLAPLLRGRSGAVPEAQRALTLAIHRDALAELDRDLAAGLIDDAQYRISCAELERRVLDEAGAAPTSVRSSGRWVAIVSALAVPVFAVPVYLALGNPEAVDAPRSSPSEQQAMGQEEITPERIRAMVEQLAERMKSEPDNADGWQMLARSYSAMERFDEASAAYANLVKIVSGDAQVWTDYADVLAMSKGRQLSGEPEAMLAKALAIDPDHPKALALAGSAAMQRGDKAGARKHWERLLKLLPPESPLIQPLTESLQDAAEVPAN
ncbi:c-type cytochrome biogenesis protein CcmI [Methyloversatilis sp. XJ19-49]|uniref:c-type cytochrome biogenesis protein CcmI n=1 Tax=Methyloversatilis sp. XJ19-49 TaxID=2963429 RepID=UPI00211BF421|nr:c-type cytochrome biogenesis protein CcmI [Methyloversatilis sp. XJ19-49]MCQ9377922.1 c-type cytochrome biogenesis protein CcmI [Methyloversatilis sp. XJ19-49]